MGDYKYRAFISYSHADERDGDWLQRALETFRVPAPLVGKTTAAGPIPRKLTPVFRDRDDLPAAGNLSDGIKEALRQSQFQIVICSPNAAKSRWVNEEVKLFKALHGADRTLAVIVAGEPGAGAGREDAECFPPALRFEIDDKGALTSAPAEPIAADARDGRRFAVLKLAAGLIGVNLDDLVQREAHRRARNAWRVAIAASVATAAFGLVAFAAVRQGNEARRMRAEAENLIEFMLTDLRAKLDAVGKLDALDAVGERALDYYRGQDAGALDPGAASRRARALLLVGQIDQSRGDSAAALRTFEEATKTTEVQLRRAPNEPERIFDHAQAVFWVGTVAIDRGDLAKGERYLREYLRLAERLVAIDAKNTKWQLELAYATNNLAVLKHKAGDYAAAVPLFEGSIAARRALLDEAPGDREAAAAYAYAISWVAFSELKRGRFDAAAARIGEQLAVYEPILAAEPDNFALLPHVVTARRRLYEAHVALGDLGAARREVAAAAATAERLIARESANAGWRINAAYVEMHASRLAGFERDFGEEARRADRAVALLREVVARDPARVDSRVALGFALARRTAARNEPGVRAGAAEELAALIDAGESPDANAYAAMNGEGALELARFAAERGDGAAQERWCSKGLAALKESEATLSALSALTLVSLHFEAGDLAAARQAAAALDAIGLAHPDFVELKSRLATAAL